MPDIPTKPSFPLRGIAGTREAETQMRHERMPINVNVNVSFHTDADPAVGKRVSEGEDPLDALLPAESKKRLIGMEPQLMKWLAASDANRLLFLSDPIAALQQVDKKLDRTFLKQLRRARGRSATEETDDPRARLSQVRVAVVTQPVKPAPGDTKPPKK